MNILIVTGGKMDLSYICTFIEEHQFDRVIAADSGLKYCQQCNLLPTDILGDFDSLEDLSLLDTYKERGIPVYTFPCRKDFTDTDLALQYVTEKICDKETPHNLWIVGGTGSRMDHTMANIGMLARFAGSNIQASIVDKNNTITMIKGPCRLHICKKEERPFLSVIACTKDVRGLSVRGVSYPLEKAELPLFESLGISNEITEKEAEIELEQGYMLIIESRD